MKFNAIVGNPPYQLSAAKKETENGQKSVVNIFHYFQMASDELANHTSLIYPGGRWIHRSGKGLNYFGFTQINDPHLQFIEFFQDASEIFDSADIADGLTIVMKNMKKLTGGFDYVYSQKGVRSQYEMTNPGNNLMPLNPINDGIIARIEQTVRSNNFRFLHNSVLSRCIFSIESDFVEKNPTSVRPYSAGATFNNKTEIKLLTNDKAGKSGRAKWYIANRSVVTSGLQYLDKWKVIVSSANAGGQKRSNQLEIVDNHSAFGRARVALKTFDTKKEAENFCKYVQSDLIKFAFLLTDEALTSLAKLVPDILNYKDDNGIIDFSKDVNSQLFSLFNIDIHQQKHIQKVLLENGK